MTRWILISKCLSKSSFLILLTWVNFSVFWPLLRCPFRAFFWYHLHNHSVSSSVGLLMLDIKHPVSNILWLRGQSWSLLLNQKLISLSNSELKHRKPNGRQRMQTSKCMDINSTSCAGCFGGWRMLSGPKPGGPEITASFWGEQHRELSGKECVPFFSRHISLSPLPTEMLRRSSNY